MFVLRPSRLADLPALEAIAARSAIGITSLPDNFWGMLLAFFLFQANWIALQGAGGWTR